VYCCRNPVGALCFTDPQFKVEFIREGEGPQVGFGADVVVSVSYVGSAMCDEVSKTVSCSCSSDSPLEELIVPELVTKLAAFYGTQRLIIAIPTTCHPALSWGKLIQSMPSHTTY
jgi:hypothetical protein